VHGLSVLNTRILAVQTGLNTRSKVQSLRRIYIEQSHEALSAPSRNHGRGRQNIAQPPDHGASEFLRHGATELRRGANYPAGANQQQPAVRLGFADPLLHPLAREQMREHVHCSAALQRVDALVKHSDFDHKLGHGELMPFANRGEAVFDGLRGGKHRIANAVAIVARGLAKSAQSLAEMVSLLPICIAEGLENLRQRERGRVQIFPQDIEVLRSPVAVVTQQGAQRGTALLKPAHPALGALRQLFQILAVGTGEFRL
jgi:hypothetical protein